MSTCGRWNAGKGSRPGRTVRTGSAARGSRSSGTPGWIVPYQGPSDASLVLVGFPRRARALPGLFRGRHRDRGNPRAVSGGSRAMDPDRVSPASFSLSPPAPDRAAAILLPPGHGYHHEFPNDRLRLVAPPLMFWTLAVVFGLLYYVVFGGRVWAQVFSGTVAGYLAYDCIHYYTHMPFRGPGWVGGCVVITCCTISRTPRIASESRAALGPDLPDLPGPREVTLPPPVPARPYTRPTP